MKNKLLQTFNSMVSGKNTTASSNTISRLKVPLMAFLMLYATACSTNEESYDSNNDLNPKMTELLNEYKTIYADNPYRQQERDQEFRDALMNIDAARTNVEKNVPKLLQKIESELALEGDSLHKAILLMDLNTPSAIFADAKLNQMGFNTTLNANADYTDDPSKKDEINMTPFFAAIEALGQERQALESSQHKITKGEQKNTFKTENYAVVLDAGRMSDGMDMHEDENPNINQNAYFFNNEDFPSVETIRESRPGGVVVVTHPDMNPDIQGYLSFLVESGIKVYVFCVDNSLNPVDIDQDQLADVISTAQKDSDAGYTDNSGQAYHQYHSHSGGFYPWYIYSHMYSHPYSGGGSYTSHHTKSVTYVSSGGARTGMTGKSFRGSNSTFGGRTSGIGRSG